MKRKSRWLSSIACALLTCLILSSPKPAHAGLRSIWKLISGDTSDVETFVGQTIGTAMMSGVSKLLTDCKIDAVVSGDCNPKDPLQNQQGHLPGGGIGMLAMTIDEMRHAEDAIPLNLALYSKDLAAKLPFGIVSPQVVYAFDPIAEFRGFQGQMLNLYFESVVLNLWKTTRNIAYSIIVMILVIVGFMIMFRKKINPQLTVSIANALPRLVLGVILITFSYPIAALTIPLISALSAMADKLFANTIVSSIEAQGLMMFLFKIIKEFSLLFVPGVNIFSGVIVIVMLVSLFFAIFSVFFTLISRFVKIMLATIFGPLVLAIGIIPGQEQLTSDWIKGLLINAISVPAIFAVFYLGCAFFIPIPTSGPIQEIFDTFVGHYVRWGLGIGIMLYARKVPGALSEALKAPPTWVPAVVVKKGR